MGTITTKIVDTAAAGGGTGSLANPLTFAEMVTAINAGSAGAGANTEYVLNPGTFTRSTTATITNGGSSSGQCIIRARYPRPTTLPGVRRGHHSLPVLPAHQRLERLVHHLGRADLRWKLRGWWHCEPRCSDDREF